MAITAFSGEILSKVNQDVYIQELWSDMVLRYIHAHSIMTNLCFNATEFWGGQKGDKAHVPWMGRLAVSPWVENTPVNLQTLTDTEFTFEINRAMEASFAVSDISKFYNKYDVARMYIEEQGFAKLEDIENFILAQRAGIYYVAAQNIYNTSDGTITGTKLALGKAGIMAAAELLNKAKVPRENRFAVVSPSQAQDVLAIAEHSSRDYNGGATPYITGMVLDNYMGFRWFESPFLTENTTTGFTNGTNGAASPAVGVTGSMYLPTQGNYTALPTTGGGTNNYSSAMFGHPNWCAFTLAYQHDESGRLLLHQADANVSTWIMDSKVMKTDHLVLCHTMS